MTVRDLLNKGAVILNSHSETPRLDCSILLSEVMGVDRAKLLASYPDLVSEEILLKYNNYLELRVQGHPVAYILNEKEFYGYTFYLEKGVLTPRPDTEILVETALNIIDKNNLKSAVDMCTGTGCIAISLKKQKQELDIIATDISPISKRVFAINNNRLLDGEMTFIHSNLFENLKDKRFDIIVSNPPYLTKKETDDRVDDGWQEPILALDGGFDGLDLIRIIIKDAPHYLNKNGWLIIEADPLQMLTMQKIMKTTGFTEIEVFKDLATLDRIIVGKYE